MRQFCNRLQITVRKDVKGRDRDTLPLRCLPSTYEAIPRRLRTEKPADADSNHRFPIQRDVQLIQHLIAQRESRRGTDAESCETWHLSHVRALFRRIVKTISKMDC